MRLDRTFAIDVPPGWNVAARRKPESFERLIHAATIPLPRERGDYGSGVLTGLGPDDVFLSIMEHGAEAIGSPLFAVQGVPVLRPSEFAPNAMQQVLPGRRPASGSSPRVAAPGASTRCSAATRAAVSGQSAPTRC